MGVWGTGLYSNDTTCDVRDSYTQYLQDGLNDEEAYSKLMGQFEELFQNHDDAPLAWYALAETMWKAGRLSDSVKDTAIHYIHNRGGFDIFPLSEGKRWIKTLEKLEIKLSSPQPKRKDYQKYKIDIHNPWDVGDVYAYRISEKKQGEMQKEKYLLFRKVGNKNDGGLSSVIEFYNEIFEEIPDRECIKHLSILPNCPYETFSKWFADKDKYYEFSKEKETVGLFYLFDKRDYYPEKRLVYLGNVKTKGYEYEERAWNKFYSFSFYKDQSYLLEVASSWAKKSCWPDGAPLPKPEIGE